MTTNTISPGDKFGLTIEEASQYFGIGQKKLRQMTAAEDCPYVLWVGGKRLIRRQDMEEYLKKQFSI